MTKLAKKTFFLATRCVLPTLMALAVAACQGPVPAQPAMPLSTPGDCESSARTDADTQYALSLGNGLFDQGDWQRSLTVVPQKVTVSWTNEENNAVAIADYSIFECSYEEDLLTSYFTDDYFEKAFSEYDSYARVDECTGENLKLWEFETTDQGQKYMNYVWAQPNPPVRLLVFSLVFPADKPALMDQYARALFPQLPACK